MVLFTMDYFKRQQFKESLSGGSGTETKRNLPLFKNRRSFGIILTDLCKSLRFLRETLKTLYSFKKKTFLII
jgi:hypothetical protein